MLDYLSDLQLNSEMLRLDREFCEGLAVAYQNSAERTTNSNQREVHLAFSATNFRRAGAHAILLDDAKSANTSFAKAAEVYARLQMPYGLMMSALSDVRNEETTLVFETFLRRFKSREEVISRSLQRQWVYVLMFHSSRQTMGQREWGNIEGLVENVRRELESSRSSPIGILALPVHAYLNLSSALAGSGDLLPEEALLPFLSAYNTALRLASRDAYHWRMMAIPFHPAEPDILSVLVLAHSVLQRRNQSVFDLLKAFPLSPQARTILNDALEGRIQRG